MRKLFLASALALSLGLPTVALAQDHSQVVREVIARLQAQNVDMSGACGAFRITNAVALKLPGYRLLRKAGGWRAIPQANGSCLDGDHAGGPGYATDYLISVNEGFVGYDLLGDGGGANTPQWLGPENDPEMVSRNVQNNAEPLGSPAPAPIPVPVPTPFPPPVVTPPPVVVPPSSTDYTTLLERILDSQSTLLQSVNQLYGVSLDTNAHVKNMDRTLTQTLGAFSAFVGKYIAPAIGGYILAKQLGKSTTPAVTN